MVHRGPGQPQGVNQVEGGDGLVHPAVSGDEVLQVAADREPAASLGTHRHLPVQGGEKEGVSVEPGAVGQEPALQSQEPQGA